MKKAIVLTAMILSLIFSGCSNASGAASESENFVPVDQAQVILDKMSLEEKINAIVTKVYGGDGVDFTPTARKEMEKLEGLGFGGLPVCMAKTQYSLSDDPSKMGRPEGFRVTVRNMKVSAGAGFVVVLTGDVMTMPGLPKVPAAVNVDVDENGKIKGLF